MAEARYQINNPPVVSETLDGEATIVDLESGTYYALNESGTVIWDGLGRGLSTVAVADVLAGSFGLDPAPALEAVESLAAELLDRKLIREAAAAEPPTEGVAAANGAPAPHGPYSAPELSTFTDMQELLLLDPVHEVDEAGWPVTQ